MQGSLMCAVTATGLIAVGAAGAAAPRLLAKGYGIAPDSRAAVAYVRAAGARDIVCGGALLSALATGSLPALRGTMLWLSLIPVADFVVVAAHRGRPAAWNLCLHASGALAMVAMWTALRPGHDDR